MNLEGEIGVRVGWDGRRVGRVGLRSSRPDVASAVLSGREVGDAIALVTHLFSLCGRAQGIAATLACEAAQGGGPGATQPARAWIVDAERIAEFLWHELLDAPMLVGAEGAARALAAARAALDRAAALRSCGDPVRPPSDAASPADERQRRWPVEVLDAAATHVFGEPPGRWLERWGGSLDAWARTAATPPARILAEALASAGELGRVAVRLLPPLDGPLLASAIAPAMDADDGFPRAPTFDGSPAETGSVAAFAGHAWVGARIRDGDAVSARLGARLLELATLLGGGAREIPLGGVAIGPGDGVGWVRTARGDLIHRVEVVEGRARRWRIVAPTEWNFHPGGALAAGLRALRAGSAARVERLAALLVHSLDPCVACAVEVGDA